MIWFLRLIQRHESLIYVMNIISYLQYLKAALYLSGIQKDLIYFKSL